MLISTDNNLSSLIHAAVVLFLTGVLAMCTTIANAQFDAYGNLDQNMYPGTDRGYYGGTARGSQSERDFLNQRYNDTMNDRSDWDRSYRESVDRFQRQNRENEASTFGHAFYSPNGKITICRQTGPNTSVCQ